MREYQILKSQSIRYYSNVAEDVSSGLAEPWFFNSGFLGIETEVDDYNRKHKKYCLPYVHLIEHYKIDTTDKTVLEVACGFGRGCFFLKSRYNATSVTGCDINPNVISVAQQLFTKTKFFVADVVNLQTIQDKYDIVLTIETAPYWVNYPGINESFASVVKQGGSLLIASDIRRTDSIKLPGFRLVGELDITDNVLLSLNQHAESQKQYSKRIKRLETNYRYVSQHYIRE